MEYVFYSVHSSIFLSYRVQNMVRSSYQCDKVISLLATYMKKIANSLSLSSSSFVRSRLRILFFLFLSSVDFFFGIFRSVETYQRIERREQKSI